MTFGMLALPTEVLCGGILPHLSVCDLQALDTAFTNKYLRPQLRHVWKSYQYDAFDVELEEDEVGWLCRADMPIISLIVIIASHVDSFVSSLPTLKKLHINSEVPSTVFKCLEAHCPNLEELSVNYVYGPNIDNAVSALAHNCRQLHTLQISSSHLTDAGISSLALYGNQLLTLFIGDARITDAGIQALCDNCPHLKHIELLRCINLTDASLISIANSYPHLEIVKLWRPGKFTDDGLIYFADKCHELRSVSVSCKNITKRGLTALWAANPNLMDVDISYNEFISDDDIIQLVQFCPLLQKLNISHCGIITDAAVITVAEHGPQLRSLNICGCYDVSDASLIALGQHCHELIAINISFLKNISDVGIAALAAGCPLLQEFYARSTNITDAGVVALAFGCRDLHKINVMMCEKNGFHSISAIAQKCPLISELNFSFCAKVDDACLYVIAQHCRNLTVIDVSSYRLSDDVAAVRSVITSCRFLRVFRCYDCFINKARLQQHISSRLLHVFKEY